MAVGIGALVTTSPTPPSVPDRGDDDLSVALPRDLTSEPPTPEDDTATAGTATSADGGWADIAGDGAARARSEEQREHLTDPPDAGSTEPDPTEPDSTEPDSTEPDPTDQDSTDPDPAGPDSTEPHATDAACVTPQGHRCAHPMLPEVDAVAAVAVSKGAIVLDRDGTLTRLRVGTQGQAMRWRTTVGAVAGRDAGTGSDDRRWHLSRSGSALVVASSAGIAVHDIGDGTVRWRMEVDAGPRPWQAWAIDDAVLAVGQGRLVAVDLADGAHRWDRSHPTGDAQPTEVGVALHSRDRLTMFTPESPTARWSVTVPPEQTSPVGLTQADPGPVVSIGDQVRLHDAADGTELARFSPGATATRTRSGVTVVAVWADGSRRPTLLGLDEDGAQRWSRTGPAVPCCDLVLRALEDGGVVAAPPTRPGRTEVGEVLDPDDGSTLATLRRPGRVRALPRAVGGDTAVWQDGSTLVGAAATRGDIRWSTGPDSEVLLESPLLLATPDGVLAP